MSTLGIIGNKVNIPGLAYMFDDINRQAKNEGWYFGVSDDSRYVILAFDDIFATDKAAWNFVNSQAMNGSTFHETAIRSDGLRVSYFNED